MDENQGKIIVGTREKYDEVSMKKSARDLFLSGIVGSILTALFIASSNSFGDEVSSKSVGSSLVPVYLILNTLCILVAGYYLKKNKRIGIYLLLLEPIN